MNFFDIININVLQSAIRLATPVILAALGAAICNKAGVLNLGIDGFITMSAFVAIVSTYLIRNFTRKVFSILSSTAIHVIRVLRNFTFREHPV